MEAARAEADRRNIHNPTIVGTKEGVINALRTIVGPHIIDKIAKALGGSDFVSINNFTLHEALQYAITHAA